MSLGGSKPSGSTTTTQTSEPWSGQKPYLENLMREAGRLYGTGVNGGGPQYDNAKYNAALDAWKKDPGATIAGVRQAGQSVTGYTLSDGRIVDAAGKTGLKVGDMWGDSKGPMPTLDQFAIEGTGGGTNSLLAPGYYPGQTIADQSPETIQAQNMITQRATQGSPVMNTANGYLSKVLNGDFIGANPYLDSQFKRGADQVQARVNSAFAGGGRSGSGINQEVMTREMGNLANDVYGNAYENERQRMQQGLLFAPQAANQDYADALQLANVGQAKEGRTQDVINADIAKYNYQAQLPLNALANYQQLVSGNYGGSTTMTQPYYSNRGAGMLGTGLGLLSGASMLSGMGAFGGGGLLSSLFGGAGASSAGGNASRMAAGMF